jgi:hypothetical protein
MSFLSFQPEHVYNVEKHQNQLFHSTGIYIFIRPKQGHHTNTQIQQKHSNHKESLDVQPLLQLHLASGTITKNTLENKLSQL